MLSINKHIDLTTLIKDNISKKNINPHRFGIKENTSVELWEKQVPSVYASSGRESPPSHACWVVKGPTWVTTIIMTR